MWAVSPVHFYVDFSSGGSLASTESSFDSQSHETLKGKQGERRQHAPQHVDEALWMSVKFTQPECAQFCVFRAQDDVVLLRHLDRHLRGSVLMLRWSDEERLSPSEARTVRNTLERNWMQIGHDLMCGWTVEAIVGTSAFCAFRRFSATSEIILPV